MILCVQIAERAQPLLLLMRLMMLRVLLRLWSLRVWCVAIVAAIHAGGIEYLVRCAAKWRRREGWSRSSFVAPNETTALRNNATDEFLSLQNVYVKATAVLQGRPGKEVAKMPSGQGARKEEGRDDQIRRVLTRKRDLRFWFGSHSRSRGRVRSVEQ